MGAPPTGRELEVTGMAKIRADEGKVQEDHIHSNPQEMMEQLGLAGD